MSPPRRRATYKPRRDRRELAIAVMSSIAIVVVTAVVVWVLRPNRDAGSEPTPVTIPPTVTTMPTPATDEPGGEPTGEPTDTTAAPEGAPPAESPDAEQGDTP